MQKNKREKPVALSRKQLLLVKFHKSLFVSWRQFLAFELEANNVSTLQNNTWQRSAILSKSLAKETN